MEGDEPTFVDLPLSEAAAVVLYDWLVSLDWDALPAIKHRAQKQALADLVTSLETHSRAEYATEDELRAAQETLARDMGW
jgi:hypothetical protein